jgi:hypothetical protein
MPRFPVITTVVVPILLSACAQNGSTGKSASPDPEVVSSSIVYSSTYADEGATNESAMMDGGVSGFVANADGSLSQIRIRISEDGETAYVSIDGVPETEWSTRTSANGNSGHWTSDDDSLLVNWSGNSNTYVTLSDDDGTHTAIVGLETPLDALPTGTASYKGNWSTSGSSGGSGQGSFNLAIDFSGGTIGGGMNGSYNAPDVNGSISGNVEGIATDSRIAGSITLDEGDVTGLLLFQGAVYGPDAKSVAGALGGTFDTVLGSDAQSGTFSLNGSGR